jgi:hypothetical protein
VAAIDSATLGNAYLEGLPAPDDSVLGRHGAHAHRTKACAAFVVGYEVRSGGKSALANRFKLATLVISHKPAERRLVKLMVHNADFVRVGIVLGEARAVGLAPRANERVAVLSADGQGGSLPKINVKHGSGRKGPLELATASDITVEADDFRSGQLVFPSSVKSNIDL